MAKIYLKYFGPSGLAGGLNTTDNPVIVAPQAMVKAQNVLIGRTVSRKKRGGLERFTTSSFVGTSSYPTVLNPGTSASSIRGMIQYWRYGSSTGEPTSDIFLHQGDKVWSIESRTTPGIDRTGTLTLSDDSIPSYQVFEGILYFCSSDTNNGYNKWNGVSSFPGDAEAASAPADGPGKFLRAHIGRMWMAGNPAFPFRLYYSAPLDAEDWSTVGGGGSLDISYDGDPDGITAIFPPFQGRLYVATRRTIYEITGFEPDDFIVRPVTQGIGCVSHNAAVATPNDIIFPSDRGVHSLVRVQVSDQSELNFLSRDIQATWVQTLNRPLLSRVNAMWDQNSNSYIITATSSGQSEQDMTLVYNLQYGIWTQWMGINARAVCQLLLSNQEFVGVGRENGEIAFINESKIFDLDNTTGYAMSFRTGKIFPDDQIDMQWRFHSVTILASVTRRSTIGVSWTCDTIDGQQGGSKAIELGNDTDSLGVDFVLGQSTLGFGQFTPKKISVDIVGYNFQLDITVSGQSDIEFHGFILEAENAGSFYT